MNLWVFSTAILFVYFSVEVINGKVETRKLDSVNEMYVPTATSPYAIVVNEGVALVQLHDSPASTSYLSLLRKITKPISQIQLLGDVLNNIDELRDKYIDLLVLVTFVRSTFCFNLIISRYFFIIFFVDKKLQKCLFFYVFCVFIEKNIQNFFNCINVK